MTRTPTEYDARQLVAAIRAYLDAGDRDSADHVALLSLEQAFEWGRTAEVRAKFTALREPVMAVTGDE